MSTNLKNKIVVITGASAGVGRATCIAFAKHGCQIALIARGNDGLEGAKNDVEKNGGTARIYTIDVSDSNAIAQAADQIETEMGPIDIWINNAMCSVFAPIKQITPEEFKRVTEVTYLGQVYGTMAALKHMLPRNAGTIVLIGSALAYRGIPLQSAYCGAKHGVEGFFESLRCELFHDQSKVHLTIVQLPAMNTPQFGWVMNKLPNKPRPMGTVFEPEVAAKAIVFAATHQRRQVYVGYPTFEAIIANKIAPGLMDKYLGKIGYKGQQTEEKKDPNHQNNVWQPLPGDRGPHGTFGKEAHHHSLALWFVMHKELGWFGLLCVLALIILSVWLMC